MQTFTRTITAKVTANEHEAIRSTVLATGETVSVWLRQLATQACAALPPDPSVLLLSEVLALRSILVTLIFQSNHNIPLTEQSVREIIQQADQEKLNRALSLLNNHTGDIQNVE